jgi:alpha-beta hydrolase superfamily lysophospholipase
LESLYILSAAGGKARLRAAWVMAGTRVRRAALACDVRGPPELSIRHRAHLDETLSPDSAVSAFAGYLWVADGRGRPDRGLGAGSHTAVDGPRSPFMPGELSRILRRALRTAGYTLLGALVVVLAGFAYYVRSQPDLSVWHLADLDEEFSASSEVADFAGYLALEDRLFAQLDTQIYAKVPTGPEQMLNRYSRGSLADPDRWPTPWNRSFEHPSQAPRAGVLLLHGLSDSPYSMRALGERLAAEQAWVVGLRVPGHGTAPSGLTSVRWQDMAAAVVLAMRHLRSAVGDAPLYVVGYSNGGALAVEYALSALADASLPRLQGIALMSPEIGVARAAALASWLKGLGRVPGLEKLAWTGIEPEYDPFKYNSFATNAGDLAYRITARIQKQLGALDGTGKLREMPRILAFQSAVDATVTASALVQHLLARLPAAGHELVLFDINRRAGIEPMLKADPRAMFAPMWDKRDLGFDLTLVTNASAEGREVIARHKRDGESAPTESAVVGSWPPGVYSLAHIAIPFTPRDPVYGGPDAPASPGVHLGNVALRGERGVLRVPGGTLLRMHWNPFYDHLESRVIEFMELGAGR